MNYTTPCSTEQLRCIRNFISQQIAQTALSEQERHQVILAVDEACANAIIHGNACDDNRNLCLEIDVKKDKIAIEIYDIGNYRPNEMNWAARNIRNNIRQKKKGGMGLRIIHYVMDKVRYYNRGKVNVCRLTKKIMP